MSENLTLWIFGVVMAVGGGWLSWLTGQHGKLSSSNVDAIQRLQRLEMVLIMISNQAAKLLHNDDNKHGLDHYIDMYLDRHYELSHKEWTELLENFERVMNDESKPTDSRLAASLVFHICRHKLMLPPDKTLTVQPKKPNE